MRTKMAASKQKSQGVERKSSPSHFSGGGRKRSLKCSRCDPSNEGTFSAPISSTSISRYFMDAPSFASGSVRTLGPFLHTLGVGVYVNDATEQFQDCPTFRRRFRELTATTNATATANANDARGDDDDDDCSSSSSSKRASAKNNRRRRHTVENNKTVVHKKEQSSFSEEEEDDDGHNHNLAANLNGKLSQYETEIEEYVVDRSVRHLCRRNCYLRAFAPAREWHALRTTIRDKYKIGWCGSLDGLLTGWRCVLQPLEEEEGEGEESRRDEDKEKKFLPRVGFVSPEGEVYGRATDVVRKLGLEEKTSGRGKKGRKRKSSSSSSSKSPKGRNNTTTSANSVSKLDNGTQNENAAAAAAAAAPVAVTPEHTHNIAPPASVPVHIYNLRRTEARARRQIWHEQLRGSDGGAGAGAGAGATGNNHDDDNDEEQRHQRESHVSSPFGLIEELFPSDPWRLLISTIMLNQTTRRQVDPVLHKFLSKWKNATEASTADAEDVLRVVSPLGLQHKRARALVRFSKEYLDLVAEKSEATSAAAEEAASASIDEDGEQTSRYFSSASRAENENNSDDGDGGELASAAASWSKKNKRSDIIAPAEFAFSEKDVLRLHWCGRYALGAYQIFVRDRLDVPYLTDHALHYYVDWKRSERGSCGHCCRG